MTARKHHQSTKPNSSKMAKLFFFFDLPPVKTTFIYTVHDPNLALYTYVCPNLGWQLECFCILHTFDGKSSANACIVCKRKSCQVDLDDDMEFQSSSQWKYKRSRVQYMGRQLKMHFRVEEMGKLQWFKGQILNYEPTSSQ